MKKIRRIENSKRVDIRSASPRRNIPRKPLWFIALLGFILALLIFLGTTLGDIQAADGYHTGYHTGNHSVYQVYVPPFSYQCGICGGRGTAYRYEYHYDCGGVTHKARAWSWYQCHASWGELVEYDRAGNYSLVSREDSFHPDSYVAGVSCPGYLVPNTYTVAYGGGGGSGSVTDQVATYDQTFHLRQNNYTYPGYHFQGWKVSGGGIYANGQAVRNLSVAQNGRVTMTAEWSPNVSNVFFFGNGGIVDTASKKVTYGSTYGDLPIPVREGFAFQGWFDAAGGEVQGHQNPSAVYQGVDYGAVFNFKFYCSLYGDIQRAFGTDPAGAMSHFVNYGMKEERQGSANFNLNYYRQKYGDLQKAFGTNLKSYYLHYIRDGFGEGRVGAASRNYTTVTVVSTVGNHNLYAHWTQNSYQVTYDANGGSLTGQSSATVRYGDMVDLKPEAILEGKIFVGWDVDRNAREGMTDFVMPAKDSTLYAVYSIPVSDIKEVSLLSWATGNAEEYQIQSMECLEADHLDYIYGLSGTQLIDALKLDENIAHELGKDHAEWAVMVWDHAGNYTVLRQTEEAPVPEWYLQTVEHCKWEEILEQWVLFETVTETRMKGEIYEPRYIAAPEGYQEDHIDLAYQVEEDMTSRAYYSKRSYQLNFDANGGSCPLEFKTIQYGALYGDLPGAGWVGHQFQGWYTQAQDGERVTGSHQYLISGDSTLYAHWEREAHMVSYDYRTNGGTGAEWESQKAFYGSELDLSVEAWKEDWEHIGWNVNPDAQGGLSGWTMEEEDLVLYAIFRKKITVSYVDRDHGGVQTRQETVTLYNREVSALMQAMKLSSWTGWQPLGWSLDSLERGVGGSSDPWEKDPGKNRENVKNGILIDVTEGAAYRVSDDTVLYGCYGKPVTIRYDTNGAYAEYHQETGEAVYHGAGLYRGAAFVLEQSPNREQYSFVGWQNDREELEYPGVGVELLEDTNYLAVWDGYPEIQAYDRYFTLEQAKSGTITTEVLLEQVKAADPEEGPLMNGSQVTVIHYQPEDFTGFTEAGSVSVTYQAIDSVGNQTTRLVMAHIVDTAGEILDRKYVRFISLDFFADSQGAVEEEKGGLKMDSVWRQQDSYRSALERALTNQKINTEAAEHTLFGTAYQQERPGSGTWEHQLQCWNFSNPQVREIQREISEYGWGISQEKQGIQWFYEKYADCVETVE